MGRGSNTPFDKLLVRYGINRSTLVKKMAKDDLKGCEKTPSYLADLKYRQEIRKKDISRYARQQREPGMTMFYYLSQMIGCSPEELLSTLKQNKQIRFENQNKGDEFKFILEQSVPKPLFFIELADIFVICFSDGNIVCRNYYKLKCLQNGLENIQHLDSYRCAGKRVEFNSQKSNFSLEKEEQANGYTYLNVVFYEPLAIGEEVSITTDCHFPAIRQVSSNFPPICIHYPTKLLTINFMPQELGINTQVQLYRYKDQNAFTDNRSKTQPKSFVPDYNSMRWRTEINNPILHSYYKVAWK